MCEDGLFILKYIVHHAHGEKMERVKIFANTCSVQPLCIAYSQHVYFTVNLVTSLVTLVLAQITYIQSNLLFNNEF
jgi:hypothetical protein